MAGVARDRVGERRPEARECLANVMAEGVVRRHLVGHDDGEAVGAESALGDADEIMGVPHPAVKSCVRNRRRSSPRRL